MLDMGKDDVRDFLAFLLSCAGAQVCKISFNTREHLFHRYNWFKSISKCEVNQGVREDRTCTLSAQ